MAGLYLLTLHFEGEAPIDLDRRRIERCLRAGAGHFKFGWARDLDRRLARYRRIFRDAGLFGFHPLCLGPPEEIKPIESRVLGVLPENARARSPHSGRMLEWLLREHASPAAVVELVTAELVDRPNIHHLPGLGMPIP